MELIQKGATKKPVLVFNEVDFREHKEKLDNYFKYRKDLKVSTQSIKKISEADSKVRVFKEQDTSDVLNLKKGYYLALITDMNLKIRKGEAVMTPSLLEQTYKESLSNSITVQDIINEKTYIFNDSILADLYTQAFFKVMKLEDLRKSGGILELKGFSEKSLLYAGAQGNGTILVPIDIDTLEEYYGKSLELRSFSYEVERIINGLNKKEGYLNLTSTDLTLQDKLDLMYTSEEQESLIRNSVVFVNDFIKFLVPYSVERGVLDSDFEEFNKVVDEGLRVSKRLKTGNDYTLFKRGLYGFSKGTRYEAGGHGKRGNIKTVYSVVPLTSSNLYGDMKLAQDVYHLSINSAMLESAFNKYLTSESTTGVLYLGTTYTNQDSILRDNSSIYDIVSQRIDAVKMVTEGIETEVDDIHSGALVSLVGNVYYVPYSNKDFETAKDFYYNRCTEALNSVFCDEKINLPKWLLNSVGLTKLSLELIRLRDKSDTSLRALEFRKVPYMTWQEYKETGFDTTITLN